jgi:hypothetical protein
MKSRNFLRRLTAIFVTVILVLALVTPALAQRRGGGFGRSGGFGGGFSRPRSGGSFGSGGFGSRTAPRYSPPPSSGGFQRAPGSSSFGRSGAFGNSGRTRATSINGRRVTPPPAYGNLGYDRQTTVYRNGSAVPAFAAGLIGGYSLGVLTNPWTHYMPFHPGFYVNPPVYYNGAYYGGGFSFTRLLLGILIIGGVIWLFSRFIRGGGGRRRIKYTNF